MKILLKLLADPRFQLIAFFALALWIASHI